MNNEQGRFRDLLIEANENVINASSKLIDQEAWWESIMVLNEFLLYELPIEQRVSALFKRGLAYRLIQTPQREYTRAEIDFKEALELTDKQNDVSGELTALSGLMDLYRTGNRDECFEKQIPKALEIETDIKEILSLHPKEHSLGQAQAYENLGLLELENWKGHEPNYKQSLIYYEKALETIERLDTDDNQVLNRKARILSIIGIPLNKLKKYEEGISYLEEALKVNIQLGNIRGKENALRALARLHYNSGDLEKAKAYLNHALRIAKEHEDNIVIKQVEQEIREFGLEDN